MKKQILNLGKALNKAEQKEVSGGNDWGPCRFSEECQIKYNDPYAVCYKRMCVLS